MFGGDPSLMEESKKDYMEPMDMSTSMKYKSKEARNFAKVLKNIQFSFYDIQGK